MYPFPVKTHPLSPVEQARVDDALAAFCQMAEEAGLLDEELELDTPELADELLIRWAAEPPQGRLPGEVIATIIGAGIGDYLTQLLQLRWGVSESPAGRSIGLVVETTGEPALSPFDAVRERLADASDGFVSDLLQEAAAEWSHLRREQAKG